MPAIATILILFTVLGCTKFPELAQGPFKKTQTDAKPSRTTVDSDEGDDPETAAPTDPRDVDYDKMGAVDALERKFLAMQPYARGVRELEIMRLAYETLLWGRKQGMWMDVNLEDLMAHARQESNEVIELLEKGKSINSAHAVGSTLWDFRMVPENDINGYISYSIWQTVEVHYLLLGRKFSPEIEKLYQDVIVKYAEDAPWQYKEKIAAKEGEAQAKVIVNKFLDDLTKIVSNVPALHVKIVSELIAEHYKDIGVRAPNAIRTYFWIDIQRNLNPDNWLNPVIVSGERLLLTVDDVHAGVRGDYGKQVALGNSYNDRGMIFWYGVTADFRAIGRMIREWKQDPAHLIKADYQKLKDQKYLTYESKYPEIFEYVLSKLPEN